jgi:undecaprenyl phosphate-alpha-L-ara4N flippase subunit ArnE
MITFSTLLLIFLSQIILAAGQVFMKKGSGSYRVVKERKLLRFEWFAAAISLMTVWFFLWLHLMTKLELNRLFAFEGMSPILVAGASAIFLREKINLKAWLATALIGAGICMVTLF